MRDIALSLIFVLTAAVAAAQVSPYYYFDKDGTTLKTVYDGEGDVIGEQEYSVVSGDGTRVLGQNVITKPGKKSETTSCHYLCDEGRLMIAMGTNKEEKEVFLDYYSGMYPGSPLIEGIEFSTQARVAGMKINVNCTISGRAVTATDESIASGQRHWKCVRTEYDMELRSSFLGIPVNVHIIEWFAPGVGVVRTDVYRKGKLYEKRLLTGFRSSGTESLATNL